MRKRRVVILGATGSIGESARKVVRAVPERMEIVGMSAHSQREKLAAAAGEYPCAKCGVSGDGGEERLIDGSTLSQLSTTDMCFSIQYAVTWPERVPNRLPPLDFARFAQLTFEAPRRADFPALDLARRSRAEFHCGRPLRDRRRPLLAEGLAG